MKVLGNLLALAEDAGELIDAIIENKPKAEIVRHIICYLEEIKDHSIGNPTPDIFWESMASAAQFKDGKLYLWIEDDLGED